MKKTKKCPECGKMFDPTRTIRIKHHTGEWKLIKQGDWATGACSRKCHFTINSRTEPGQQEW